MAKAFAATIFLTYCYQYFVFVVDECTFLFRLLLADLNILRGTRSTALVSNRLESSPFLLQAGGRSFSLRRALTRLFSEDTSFPAQTLFHGYVSARRRIDRGIDSESARKSCERSFVQI